MLKNYGSLELEIKKYTDKYCFFFVIHFKTLRLENLGHKNKIMMIKKIMAFKREPKNFFVYINTYCCFFIIYIKTLMIG